ncbi:hypothetical protein A0H81_00665 [Grifola frondosa]|uniref:Uncharacterized protein n=1 Tax=Grifola frondosa TaxID=5627 RepID=A0A1C7MPB2_GRIFR|nr:hypothetical protein A0H81_00665 [Grifola frondosa]
MKKIAPFLRNRLILSAHRECTFLLVQKQAVRIGACEVAAKPIEYLLVARTSPVRGADAELPGLALHADAPLSSERLSEKCRNGGSGTCRLSKR